MASKGLYLILLLIASASLLLLLALLRTALPNNESSSNVTHSTLFEIIDTTGAIQIQKQGPHENVTSRRTENFGHEFSADLPNVTHIPRDMVTDVDRISTELTCPITVTRMATIMPLLNRSLKSVSKATKMITDAYSNDERCAEIPQATEAYAERMCLNISSQQRLSTYQNYSETLEELMESWTIHERVIKSCTKNNICEDQKCMTDGTPTFYSSDEYCEVMKDTRTIINDVRTLKNKILTTINREGSPACVHTAVKRIFQHERVCATGEMFTPRDQSEMSSNQQIKTQECILRLFSKRVLRELAGKLENLKSAK